MKETAEISQKRDMSFTEEVGIDLGTANVLIYVDGKGYCAGVAFSRCCQQGYKRNPGDRQRSEADDRQNAGEYCSNQTFARRCYF